MTKHGCVGCTELSMARRTDSTNPMSYIHFTTCCSQVLQCSWRQEAAASTSASESIEIWRWQWAKRIRSRSSTANTKRIMCQPAAAPVVVTPRARRRRRRRRRLCCAYEYGVRGEQNLQDSRAIRPAAMLCRHRPREPMVLVAVAEKGRRRTVAADSPRTSRCALPERRLPRRQQQQRGGASEGCQGGGRRAAARPATPLVRLRRVKAAGGPPAQAQTPMSGPRSMLRCFCGPYVGARALVYDDRRRKCVCRASLPRAGAGFLHTNQCISFRGTHCPDCSRHNQARARHRKGHRPQGLRPCRLKG
jgi:hypothetical protein